MLYSQLSLSKVAGLKVYVPWRSFKQHVAFDSPPYDIFERMEKVFYFLSDSRPMESSPIEVFLASTKRPRRFAMLCGRFASSRGTFR